MYPTPTHLQGIVRLIDTGDTKRFAGTVECPCGSTEFILLHTGGVGGKGKLKYVQVAEIDGEFFLIIKARCTSCDTEHLLFDDDYHGYNGYVCAPEEGLRTRPRPGLVPWECSKCDCTAHRVRVRIIGEDKSFHLAESDSPLNESTWFEAFGWLNIDIECATCDFKLGDWVDYETM